MQRPASFFLALCLLCALALCISKFEISHLFRKVLVTSTVLFSTSSRSLFSMSRSRNSEIEEKLVLVVSVYPELYDMSDKNCPNREKKPIGVCS